MRIFVRVCVHACLFVPAVSLPAALQSHGQSQCVYDCVCMYVCHSVYDCVCVYVYVCHSVYDCVCMCVNVLTFISAYFCRRLPACLPACLPAAFLICMACYCHRLASSKEVASSKGILHRVGICTRTSCAWHKYTQTQILTCTILYGHTHIHAHTHAQLLMRGCTNKGLLLLKCTMCKKRHV